MIREVRVITARVGNANSHTIEAYRATGGYEALMKALASEPEEVVSLVKESGLRGRGGAGFPCGLKWSFLGKDRETTYLCVNADEGEPGTFKDRLIMEKDPHMLIEGILIACHAIRCEHAFIYIRGEFDLSLRNLQSAVSEARAAGLLGESAAGLGNRIDITIHQGAGAYICGEETALMSSLEGMKGQPKIKPPFPTDKGLFAKPTVVNNVETLSNLPFIVGEGIEAFQANGTKKSAGTKLFGVSGHVERPGLYELPFGSSMKELIEELCGGVRGGRKLKAVIPGGSSTPVLTAAEAYAMNLDFESMQEGGTMLGSGAVIVMDETTDMVKALDTLTRFYAHESCGQCTPCREGSGWVARLVHKIAIGEGTRKDLADLEEIAVQITGNTICVFSDATSMPVLSFVNKFRSEFEARLIDAPAERE